MVLSPSLDGRRACVHLMMIPSFGTVTQPLYTFSVLQHLYSNQVATLASSQTCLSRKRQFINALMRACCMSREKSHARFRARCSEGGAAGLLQTSHYINSGLRCWSRLSTSGCYSNSGV